MTVPYVGPEPLEAPYSELVLTEGVSPDEASSATPLVVLGPLPIETCKVSMHPPVVVHSGAWAPSITMSKQEEQKRLVQQATLQFESSSSWDEFVKNSKDS
jgi:hypothetical protein